MSVVPALLLNETVQWSFVGIAVSSIVTWFFSRRYYLRSSRERPEWIADVLEEIEAMTLAANPNADPGDLVAIFEDALRDHNFPIDKLPEAP